jgi:hypothetical protein
MHHLHASAMRMNNSGHAPDETATPLSTRRMMNVSTTTMDTTMMKVSMTMDTKMKKVLTTMETHSTADHITTPDLTTLDTTRPDTTTKSTA